MNIPELQPYNSTRQTVEVFRGYNRNLRISENEFYDMKNLTSDHYPVLSPRNKRGQYETPRSGRKCCLISKDSLGYIELDETTGTGEFYLNNYSTNGLIKPKTSEGGKKVSIKNSSITSMGAFVVIITRDEDRNIIDKKWVNTSFDALKDGKWMNHGDIEAETKTPANISGDYITHFELCGLEEDYDNIHKGNSVPDVKTYYDDEPDTKELKGGEMWLDTSNKPYSLKKYSLSQKEWVTIPTTYIKISFEGTDNYFADFEQYDGVTISGIVSDELSDLNNTMAIWEKGDNYIKVIGIFSGYYTQTDTPIQIKRKMPDVDFITESENRLWGCRYGTTETLVDGEYKTVVVNEIYSSKLGDFKNWNCFMGLSTDSYAATCGTDGVFTGAISHLGYPIFFKENCMHKVYGNFPSNYQIQTITCRGVQNGCHKSLAIVNEMLYYKSRTAVCCYDGSLPQEISYCLGEEMYSDAVAGAHGNKYYVSMKDSSDTYNLFVYDTAKGLWHKEDKTQIEDICSCRGELYYIGLNDGETDNTYDTKIKTLFGSGNRDTAPIKWMAETGPIGTSSPDKKYISKLNVRMSLDFGSRVYVFIQYNSSNNWEQVFTFSGNSLNSFSVPIRPKRCDTFKIRFEGIGEAKIYSITKTIEEGSDV
ncbi:MAG: hypothetical protein IJM97_04605 [Clostridia bacterium]|nr:hypothetical protein [Clostridia bacterium]